MVSTKKQVKNNVDDVDQETPTSQVEDVEEYQSMIAEAAYYKAEKKGFASGQEMENWLEAEKDFMSSTDNV